MAIVLINLNIPLYGSYSASIDNVEQMMKAIGNCKKHLSIIANLRSIETVTIEEILEKKEKLKLFKATKGSSRTTEIVKKMMGYLLVFYFLLLLSSQICPGGNIFALLQKN